MPDTARDSDSAITAADPSRATDSDDWSELARGLRGLHPPLPPVLIDSDAPRAEATDRGPRQCRIPSSGPATRGATPKDSDGASPPGPSESTSESESRLAGERRARRQPPSRQPACARSRQQGPPGHVGPCRPGGAPRALPRRPRPRAADRSGPTARRCAWGMQPGAEPPTRMARRIARPSSLPRPPDPASGPGASCPVSRLGSTPQGLQPEGRGACGELAFGRCGRDSDGRSDSESRDRVPSPSGPTRGAGHPMSRIRGPDGPGSLRQQTATAVRDRHDLDSEARADLGYPSHDDPAPGRGSTNSSPS
jgi:hypothetical protein